jgi:hypothetical protein
MFNLYQSQIRHSYPMKVTQSYHRGCTRDAIILITLLSYKTHFNSGYE